MHGQAQVAFLPGDPFVTWLMHMSSLKCRLTHEDARLVKNDHVAKQHDVPLPLARHIPSAKTLISKDGIKNPFEANSTHMCMITFHR